MHIRIHYTDGSTDDVKTLELAKACIEQACNDCDGLIQVNDITDMDTGTQYACQWSVELVRLVDPDPEIDPPDPLTELADGPLGDMTNVARHFSITQQQYDDLLNNDGGYCLACGEEAFHVEPDARNVDCEYCGQYQVYGIEELMVMDRLVFIAES